MLIKLSIYSLIRHMATRAKYTRVNTQNQNNETKLDTDILMRVNDTYGTDLFIQDAISPVPSRSFSERENLSSLSRLPRS